MKAQCPLNVQRRRNAGPGGGERGEERVALGTDLSPVVGPEAIADDLVVIGQRLGVDVLTQASNEIRGTLDIGEEEGQGLNLEIVGDASAPSTVESWRRGLARLNRWLSMPRCHRQAAPRAEGEFSVVGDVKSETSRPMEYLVRVGTDTPAQTSSPK